MSDASILPRHQALLDASAISSEVAAARGYRSVTVKTELKRLGFSDVQGRVPALLIPIHGVTGEVVLYQARPDEPRIRAGKPLKYETPRGARMVIDVPPSIRGALGNPALPLFVTEGARKADAAVSQGLCCVALLGVWNWRGRNDDGGLTALSDWESIALKGSDQGRRVYICFDSDVSEKPQVFAAMSRLKAFLESRGASVCVIYLPPGDAGAKVGLDDYLAAGRTVEGLLSHANSELRQPPSDPHADGQYAATDMGLVHNRLTRDGVVKQLLTNFTAEIVSEIAIDDGVELRREFEIRACLRGREFTFSLPSNKFNEMNWPTEHIGAEAVIFAGQSLRDHARCAVQVLSSGIERRIVYGHTGWRTVDGEELYLHVGGAIGKDGIREDLSVQLDTALAGFVLPPPPRDDDLRRAVNKSLALLDVAPDRVTVPLLASIYRAPIGAVDLSLHLCGPTGEGKSELAARAQQHFGAGMDSRHLPASWTSTANSLEALAFEAKDALFVVDDFAPTGTTYDIQRFHASADRLLRAQGNRSGRQRMRADGSLRLSRPPRGLILSTGEDVPRGQSLRARMVTVEIEPGTLDWPRMTQCQQAGAEGIYALAMSGFIHRIAGRLEEVRGTSRTGTERHRRDGFGEGRAHKRSTTNLASLAAAFDVLISFALDVRAVDAQQASELGDRAREAFRVLAEEQDSLQSSQEPTGRFFQLFAAALASGRAHVATEQGVEPEDPSSWGWENAQHNPDKEPTWRGRGELVGWLDDDGNLYLEPEASFAVAQRMGRDTDDPLGVGSRTLHRRLKERGLILSTDSGRLTARQHVQGQRRRVVHTHVRFIHNSPDWANRSQGPASAGAQATSSGPVIPGTGPTTGPVDGELVPAGPVEGPVEGPVDSATGPNPEGRVSRVADETGPEWEECIIR